MRRLAIFLITLSLSAGPVFAAVEGGPLGVALPLFPRNDWWNTDISTAPVDPSSASFINFIGSSTPLHPDFGGNDTSNPGFVFGFPYIVVDGSQALKTVTFNGTPAESDGVDHATNTSYPFYPVPDEAITTTGWIEDGPPGNVDDRANSDRHMLIVDKTHNWLYELYSVYYDGTKWIAGSGAFFDMNTNTRRPEGWTSADAAGLAILPGLVRYDEVSGPNEIGHALRVTVRTTNGYVYPASHVAGSSAGALPMGARLRLKASKDISSFPADVQKIFRAFKKYGLIVADNGTDMYVSGTYDTNWNNDVLNPAFGSLTANDFEVVKLGWRPAAGDFNGDGGADLVLRNGSTGADALWIMNGTALQSIVDLPALTNTNYGIEGTADFNGDGKTDIVLRNDATGQDALWIMNGTSLQSIVDLPALPDTNYRFQGTGDFNLDGNPDIILRNASTGQNALWIMNGTSLQSIVDLPALANANYEIDGAADFNGDGYADIVLRNNATGQNALWIMKGTSLQSTVDLPALPNPNYRIQAVSDFNGDGMPDIVWRNVATGQNAVWLMNGTTLQSIVDLPALTNPSYQFGGPR